MKKKKKISKSEFLHVLPRIEETWRLWQRFLDDYSRFEDWLKSSELLAARPNSSEVLYTHAKEELKKFEVNFLTSFFYAQQQAG